MEKAFDQALERFPQFNHEPYYKDYSVTDLKALFGEFGLEGDDSTVAWVSKCWSFTKKEESREDAAPSAMSETSAESAVSDEAAAEKVPEAAVEESSAEAAPAAEAAAEVEPDAVLYEFDADEDASAKEPEAGVGAE